MYEWLDPNIYRIEKLGVCVCVCVCVDRSPTMSVCLVLASRSSKTATSFLKRLDNLEA
jgi:hypothetical protein